MIEYNISPAILNYLENPIGLPKTSMGDRLREALFKGCDTVLATQKNHPDKNVVCVDVFYDLKHDKYITSTYLEDLENNGWNISFN